MSDEEDMTYNPSRSSSPERSKSKKRPRTSISKNGSLEQKKASFPKRIKTEENRFVEVKIEEVESEESKALLSHLFAFPIDVEDLTEIKEDSLEEQDSSFTSLKEAPKGTNEVTGAKEHSSTIQPKKSWRWENFKVE